MRADRLLCCDLSGRRSINPVYHAEPYHSSHQTILSASATSGWRLEEHIRVEVVEQWCTPIPLQMWPRTAAEPITAPGWQAPASCLEVAFCDRKGLLSLPLLPHVVTLYTSCRISVMSQMTGACLAKFYRGQKFLDEGARSGGSIW